MNKEAYERFKRALGRDHACYILITCKEPTANGDMQVDFSYEGDSTLAAYLLQGAQKYMEEQEDSELFVEELGCLMN